MIYKKDVSESQELVKKRLICYQFGNPCQFPHKAGELGVEPRNFMYASNIRRYAFYFKEQFIKNEDIRVKRACKNKD